MTTTLQIRVDVEDAIRFKEFAEAMGEPQRVLLKKALDALESQQPELMKGKESGTKDTKGS